MTEILGILNVTPDSFSDGGRWQALDDAVAHAAELVAQGATWIDVGGESTRPGAASVDPDAEQARVIPVVRALAGGGIPVSIDTRNAATARAAVEAGATMINDVSGGLHDPAMAEVARDTGAWFVAMHWGGGADAQEAFRDVAGDVAADLRMRVDELVEQGVARERIIVDPGLGFGKTADDNWALLHALDQIAAVAPVLVGASRKRFIGALLPEGASMADRDAPTAVISALSAQAGAWGVRVHNVAASRLALDVWDKWVQGGRR